MASARTVLAGAASAQAAVSLSAFGLPAIGPQLRVEYGLSLAALGAVLTANLLGSGVFLIPAGIVVDRYGSRLPLAVGVALGAGGLAVAAFAPTTGVLLLGLFLAGAGSSIVPVAGFGALFRAYGPERRGWALGVRQMAVPLGGTVAAVLLPLLESAGGTRLALLVSAGCVLVFGAGFLVLSEGRPPAGERPRVQVHRIVRAPGMGRLLIVAGLYIIVLQSVISFMVPAARDAGFSAFVAGAAFFVLNVTAGIARVVWGRIADSGGGRRRVRTLAEAGVLATGGAAVFAAALHGGIAALIPATILIAFGALGWNALVYVAAGEKAAPQVAAQAVAIAATLIFVVSAVSTPPMGALAAHVGWDTFWLVCAGLAAAGAAVALTLPTGRPEPVPE